MLPLALGFFGMFALDYFTPIESRLLRFVILLAVVLAVYGCVQWHRARKRPPE